MRKNSKNEKVIRAMAIGISAMLMASSPLTALAAEGEGNSSEGNEDKNITVTPEAGVCDQAKAVAKDADTAVEGAEKSATDVKAEVVDKVAAGDVKDAEGNDLSLGILNANAKVEDKTVEDGSSLKDAEYAVENADTALGVAEANDKLSDAELNKAADAAANAGQTAAEAKDAMQDAQKKVDGQIENIKDAASISDANAAYEEVKTTVDRAQADFDAKLGEYNTAKTAYEEAAQKVADYEKAYEAAINSADANAVAAAEELAAAQRNAEALAKALEAAKAAVDTSAAGALDIADKEALTRGDNGLNWKNEDQLFISIMQNYYLPEVQNITADDIKVVRRQGEDNNTKNYFEVTYTDENGNKQTKYYNYVMDDKQTSKDNIVIFEKRIEEVNWEEYQNTNPDQYVDEEGNVIDTVAGLEDGTIVKVDGKYVEKNDMTDSETLVSNSEITGTSKKDVTVDPDEKNWKESWQYNEETGELVKTVTAGVTTITYTDTTFTSDKSYATDAERDVAADAMKDKLFEDGIAATGKDATIKETEETTYTYTASGTYIPTFTKTVNVNKEYESGYLWDEADSKKEAKDKAYDWAKDQIDRDLGDYYRIGDIKSDLSVSMTEEETETYKIFGKKHTIVTDDSDYLVTGQVSATYAKVTKQTVDQSTFGALWDDIKSWFGGESTNEKLEKAAKAAIEAEGGIFLSANWDDWSFNKATIRYVAGVKVTTDEKQDEQGAKYAVEAAALAQAKANGATGIMNVNTTDINAIGHTTYSYTVDYLKETSRTTDNKIIATETYGKAIGLSGQIIQNKNYKDDNILLTQKDGDYRKFVDDAKALTGKYDRLLAEAQQANADVAAAQAKVEDLQKEIRELKNKSNNTTKLDDLEVKLESAKADRDEAEKTLNKILEKLEDAGITRDEVVDRLTPNTPGGGDGGNGGNPGGGTPGMTEADPGAGTTAGGLATVMTTTTTTTTNVAVAAQAPAGNAGAGNVVAGNAGAGNAGAGNQAVVNIDDEATPLAAGIEEQDTTDNEKADEDANTVTIEDEETALAASVDQKKMSWWWLLIVLVLGATGYEMYRKHQEKKKAAEEIKVEE